MANGCGRCKRLMSSLDDHASCPLCRIIAGECHLDVDNPCSICGKWTSKQWNSLGGLWCSSERGPVEREAALVYQPSLTLKSGLFPDQPFQPPVRGLHQKSPLWSVEMISVIGCWSVRQVR